jgi:hypothetical protein
VVKLSGVVRIRIKLGQLVFFARKNSVPNTELSRLLRAPAEKDNNQTLYKETISSRNDF